MSLLLFTSSGNGVTLQPEWDFDRKDTQVKNEHTTRAGKRYVYKWGSYCKFSFSLTFVNSSTAAILNSWWITNTKLQLASNSSELASTFSVMIIASDLPVAQYQKPYMDKFRGKIELQGY
jgi:hypothetical protein